MCDILVVDLPYTYTCGGCGKHFTEYYDSSGKSICNECYQKMTLKWEIPPPDTKK